ncbi:transcriptional regulator GutM [Planomicrobium sp. CPCC 101110]|uniref:transcriptional regulator GutM n=1 Tax=Planomicrobium sp. CPCC 101110 TaxID=2599619 RepID=UPI0011B66034|nr:transcriptional regulator GutM [Planomicrobium sp. CPCC 101110]TWT27219.1 transcriptional regulator [Planomicrobium sp. CPCC 101110]
MEILLIMVAIMVAWVLQTFLGTYQLKDFNKNYSALRASGPVSIGRSKGIVRTGVVLLMSLDKDKKIMDARKMQGLTIFAKFKRFSLLENQSLLNIDPEVYQQLDRFTQKAFDEAVEIYKKVARGEEIPASKSPLGELVSGFRKN